MRLGDDDADALDGCAFLTEQQIRADEELVCDGVYRNKYLGIGWPNNRVNYDKRKRVTNPKNLVLTGALASRAEHARRRLPCEVHVVIEFPKHELRGPNRKHGEKPPSFKGLSGGGIFSMPGLQRLGDPSPPQLVGVSVEWSASRGQYVGTRISVVLAAIDKTLRIR